MIVIGWMRRHTLAILISIVAVGATAILISCSSYGSGSRPLPACSFKVGDSVRRGTVGAIVPVRGESVNGFADGPSSSSSIEITTSNDGVVTISTAQNGVSASPEVCQLP